MRGTGILANELYRGVIVSNRSVRRKVTDVAVRQRKERPEEDWVRTRNDELRIISADLWHKLQHQREQTRKATSKAESGRLPGQGGEAGAGAAGTHQNHPRRGSDPVGVEPPARRDPADSELRAISLSPSHDTPPSALSRRSKVSTKLKQDQIADIHRSLPYPLRRFGINLL